MPPQVIQQFIELLLEIGFVKAQLALPDHPAHRATGRKLSGQASEAAAEATSARPEEELPASVVGERQGGRGKGGKTEAPSATAVEPPPTQPERQPERQPAALSGQAAIKAMMRSRPIGGAYYNVNADSIHCLRAVLCAGLYPNVVRADESEGRKPRLEGAGGAAVSLHPSTANADLPKLESRWLVYYEKVRTSKVFLRDSTMVTPYAILLFGGDIKVKHAQHVITVDKWIEFGAPPRVAVLFRDLRSELDKLLLQKIAEPELELEVTGRVLGAIVQVLSEEGAQQA